MMSKGYESNSVAANTVINEKPVEKLERRSGKEAGRF